MTMLTIRSIAEGEDDAVIAIWQKAGLARPHNPPQEDLDFMKQTADSEVLVGLLGEEVVASVNVCHDGHRGWMYYLGVDPNHSGSGYGKAMVDAAEEWLKDRSVRKVQLMIRPENKGVMEFYDRLGYEDNPCVLKQKWLLD
jgi:ribosomal protein S18 acetylase RimI-like enzyme